MYVFTYLQLLLEPPVINGVLNQAAAALLFAEVTIRASKRCLLPANQGGTVNKTTINKLIYT